MPTIKIPAKKKSLEDIFNQYRMDFSATQKSQKWYINQIQALRFAGGATTILSREKSKLTTELEVGNMYLYTYDPKHKQTLPFYDTFPLIFPFTKLPDGFMGMNFHYIPPVTRVRMLEQLLQFKSNNQLDEHTKLQLSWGLIAGAARYAPLQMCVKRYLSSHVISNFLKIEPKDWVTCLFLPIDGFVKKDKYSVWLNSMRGKTI